MSSSENFSASGTISFEAFFEAIKNHSRYTTRKSAGFIVFQVVWFFFCAYEIDQIKDMGILSFILIFITAYIGFMLVIRLVLFMGFLKPFSRRGWMRKYKTSDINIRLTYNDGLFVLEKPSVDPTPINPMEISTIIVGKQATVLIGKSKKLFVVSNDVGNEFNKLFHEHCKSAIWVNYNNGK
ncbi:MAG TPA: hypothetical protein VMV56_09715 [Williamwhitmania sp.]|nr:hypothetical protein [Williamwhitmania sp.]